MKLFYEKKSWIYTIILIFSFSFASANEEVPPTATDLSNKVSVSYSYDDVDQGFEDWQMGSISASHRFGFGSVIARLNQARRFATTGNQFEIDSYPSLREGTYMYLNTGYSSDSIFPKYRFGAEIYQSFGQGWEGSLGFRRLIFQNSNITLGTATVGKYIGNYYYLLRINTVPDELADSNSFTLQVRKYFGDTDYLAFSVGSGKSLSQIASDDRVFILNSKKAAIDAEFQFAQTWVWSAGVSYIDEEIREGVSRIDKSFSVGLAKKF